MTGRLASITTSIPGPSILVARGHEDRRNYQLAGGAGVVTGDSTTGNS